MTLAQRGADRPPHDPSLADLFPGDLFLDPDVPLAERVAIVRDGGLAHATHVWTGTGWSRLLAGSIRTVPRARPLPVRRGSAPAALTLVPAPVGGPDEAPDHERGPEPDLGLHLHQIAV